MLVRTWEGDRITPYDVLETAETMGLDGLVGTGGPSADLAAKYTYLDGWERLFLRGTYATLETMDAAANRFGVPYTCFGYGPESSHNAGDEALDPLTWVPMASDLAHSYGKCLTYGPAAMDWELRIATDEASRAALIAQVAPYVDIWMLQLGNYERWAKSGKDDAGQPFTWDDLHYKVAWWSAAIKTANPATKLWVQAGVGTTSGGKCFAPQTPEEILAYRLQLDEDGVDGMFMMPSQTCQLSTDPNDHEMYLQALEAFEGAVILSAGQH